MVKKRVTFSLDTVYFQLLIARRAAILVTTFHRVLSSYCSLSILTLEAKNFAAARARMGVERTFAPFDFGSPPLATTFYILYNTQLEYITICETPTPFSIIIHQSLHATNNNSLKHKN